MPRGRHTEPSRRVRREMIEPMWFPNVPKLEMFARGERVAGWDAWGERSASDAPGRFRNQSTHRRMARPLRGWSDTQRNKEQIEIVAARHDLIEEMASPAVKRPRPPDFGEVMRSFAEHQLEFRKTET